jgi:hypothetical protein
MNHIITVRIEQEVDEPNAKAYKEMDESEREEIINYTKREIKNYFTNHGVKEGSIKELSAVIKEDDVNLNREVEMEKKLFERVLKFMHENEINCEETIHQCDWVIENAYEFIEDLFKIVEPVLPDSFEEDE